MKNKRIFKSLAALCAAMVLMMGLSVTAFAQGTDQPPAEDATNDSNVVVEETEDSPALTPDGNAALVDDFGGNKQLITVTTKAGNYFYILIDRANEDKETAVHFLNQVDEADLMALMEDGQTILASSVGFNHNEDRKQLKGGDDMNIVIGLLKLILKIIAAPVVVVLTVAIWMCVGIVYVSGLVLGLISMVITVLGVAVLITYSPQNGIILLVIAFLLSPFGLPQLAFWLLGKVQDLKFVIQDLVYG